MIDRNVINNLKQIDVAKDGEKTKARVRELWAGLDRANRDKILELADITKFTVERTYKKGNITPRLAAAFAEVLNVNPRYLTGESDSSEGCSDGELLEFLTGSNSIKKISKKAAAKKAPGRAKKTASAAPVAPIAPVAPVTPDVFDESEAQVAPAAPIASAAPVAPAAPVAEAARKPRASKNADAAGCAVVVGGKTYNVSGDELSSVKKITEDETIALIKGLTLRSKYNAEADGIAGVIKYLLTI